MLPTAFLLQQLLNLLVKAEAAPLHQWQPSLENRTALLHHSAPSWVPEPRFRGTWSILWSCIITLILCIYNALVNLTALVHFYVN
jgi:hypothetical protein